MDNREFVDYIFKLISRDKGIRAALRRADTDNLEWKAWSVIYPALGNLNSQMRPAYSLIASSIAKSKFDKDGDMRLGESIRFADKDEAEKVSTRMERLLAVTDFEELIMVMKRILPYLINRGANVCFELLLRDIKMFSNDEYRQNVRARWMNDYLRKQEVE